MTDRALVRTVRITVAVGGGLAVVGSAVLIAEGHAGFWLRDFFAGLAVIAVFFGAFAWVVIPRQPRNAAVWTIALSSLCGLLVAGPAAVSLLFGVDPNAPFTVPAAELPASAAWTMVIAAPGFGLGFNPLTTFGFLLFPDGTLPSPRWRVVGWLASASVIAFTLAYAVSFRPTSTGPPEEGFLLNALSGAHLVVTVLCLVALVGRFRRSRGETRQQFKWVVWGAGIFVPALVAVVLAGNTPYENVFMVPFMAATAALLVSYGIAVGKYRLYDIDVVISRTLVYGTLAVFITGVYVGAVVGVGRLLGGGDEPNTALAIAATAGVAVAFQPLRRRLQRGVDRVVYGRKATPHEVLSEFSRHVAATDVSLLGQVARSLVEGTGADRAAVWVSVDGRLVEAAEWPEGGGSEGNVVSCPIEHDGVELGLLRLSTSAGRRLSEEDLRLARRVASGMGLALGNRLLTGTLRRRIAELRESRRRLVATRDETRRQLERDLHDSAQQQLVALKVKLGLAHALATKDGGIRTAASLRRLADQADGAVDAVRDFARGVYPPLLEAEGLGPAIIAQARRSPIDVAMEIRGVGRYDRQIEATVYFCVVEILHSIATRAGSSEARVRLTQSDGSVTFDITSGSAHLEPSSGGAGLVNITDRVDAANGTLTVRSEPGRGTSIRGSIPVEAVT